MSYIHICSDCLPLQVLVLRLQTMDSIEARICAAAAGKLRCAALLQAASLLHTMQPKSAGTPCARSFADRSITGGFFDGKTSAEERRAYLLGLLRADGAAGGANAGATDCGPGLNALLARSEVELAQFAALDRHLDAQERSAGLEECAPANTHSHVVSGCISASWGRIGFVVLFCVVADRLLGHMSVPPLSSAQQRETQATRRAPYQRRAGRQGDGTVSYEDPFSAASAVQWFNGKDFRGAPAGLSAHTAAQPARRPSHPPVQCRLCLAAAALAVPLSPARRPQARRSR